MNASRFSPFSRWTCVEARVFTRCQLPEMSCPLRRALQRSARGTTSELAATLTASPAAKLTEGRIGAACPPELSVPLSFREPAERDQSDERDDQPDPEAPDDDQDDSDDDEDSAKRNPTDSAVGHARFFSLHFFGARSGGAR